MDSVADDTKDTALSQSKDIHSTILSLINNTINRENLLEVLKLTNTATARMEKIRSAKSIKLLQLPDGFDSLEPFLLHKKSRINVQYIEAMTRHNYNQVLASFDRALIQSSYDILNKYEIDNIPFCVLTRNQLEIVSDLFSSLSNVSDQYSCGVCYKSQQCSNTVSKNLYCETHSMLYSKYISLCQSALDRDDFYNACRQIVDLWLIGTLLSCIGFGVQIIDCIDRVEHLIKSNYFREYDTTQQMHKISHTQFVRFRGIINSNTGDLLSEDDLIFIGPLGEVPLASNLFKKSCEAVFTNKRVYIILFLSEFYKFFTEKKDFGLTSIHPFILFQIDHSIATSNAKPLVKCIETIRDRMRKYYKMITNLYDMIPVDEATIQTDIVDCCVRDFKLFNNEFESLEFADELNIVATGIINGVLKTPRDSIKCALYNIGFTVLIEQNRIVKKKGIQIDTSDYEIYFSSTDSESKKKKKRKAKK